MRAGRTVLKVVVGILLAALIVAGMLALAGANYLLFHSGVELLAVGVAITIFSIGWNTRQFARNDMLLLLSVAYLFVAVLDTWHALSYEGMGVFPGQGPNMATQVWIAARCVEGISLLLAALVLLARVRIRPWPTAGAYALGIGVLVAAIGFSSVFPDCYVAPTGLTAFKVASEYAICGILAAAGVAFWRCRARLSRPILWMLLASIGLTILSEFAFTLYTDVKGYLNALGHVLKCASFVTVYVALVQGSLKTPYEGLFRDAAEANAALRESELRYRTVYESAPVGIGLARIDGTAITCNEAMSSMMGYSAEEFSQINVADIYRAPEKRQTLLDRLGRDGSARIDAMEMKRKDGSPYWANLVCSLVDLGGEEVIVTVVEDITARKLMDDELRFLSQITEQVRDAVIATDMDYRITYVNRGFEELYGYSLGEVLGRTPDMLNAEPNAPEVQEEIHRAVSSGEAWSGEMLNQRKDGSTFVCAATIAPLLDEEGRIVAHTSTQRDVTARRRAEQGLEAAHSALERRQTETAAQLAASQAVIAADTFTAAAVAVFDTCKELIGAESGYVALRSADRELNEVLYLDAGGRPCTVDPELPMPVRGLREVAYRTRAPVFDNAFADSKWMDFMPGGHMRLDNVLFAPLVIGSEAQGLLGFANKPGGFTEEDAQTVKAFADIAAVSLRTRLAEERMAELARFPSENPNAVLRVAADGEVLYSNRAAAPLLAAWGCEAGGAVTGRWLAMVSDAINSGKARRDDVEVDGGSTAVTFAPVVDAGFVNVYGFDISERRRAEKALETQNELSRLLMDSQPCVAMLVRPRTFEIVAVNKVAEEAGAVVGETCYWSWRRFDGPCPWCLAPEAWETGEPRHCEEEEAGTVWGAHWYPIDDDLYLYYAFDITETRRREERLRMLAARLAEVEEEERGHLARELHDQVGQALTAVSLSVGIARNRLHSAGETDSTERLDDALAQLTDVSRSIRDVMTELRPAILDDYGIVAALEWYTEAFSGRAGLPAEVVAGDPDLRLDPAAETALFRIAQEALTNAAKHAGAGRVVVSVEATDGTVRLEVRDDGCGFEAPEGYPRGTDGGWGLAIMRERAAAVGGTLSVDSSPGQGTMVVVELPR